MSSSSETACSESNPTPKRKDWAETEPPSKNDGKDGVGPGVTKDDVIQKSDAIHDQHQQKVADTVGPGPGTKQTSRPEDGDVEHREHARSPTLSPPPSREKRLNSMSSTNSDHTHHTLNTVTSRRTHQQLEHEGTMSSIRTAIGLEATAPILDGHETHDHLAWSTVRTIMREPFLEFFGTFIMVLFGDGSVAQVLLSGGQTSAPGGNGFGQYQSINWGYV
jgi:aquaglyceroporin related protein